MVLRTTYQEPRHYGARITVSELNRDEDDSANMDSTCFSADVWEQAGYLLSAAYGKKAWDKLTPHENTTSATVPFMECVYELEASSDWLQRHPHFPHALVEYREPGSHVNEDCWISLGEMNHIKKVTDEDGFNWIVASFETGDAYIMIPFRLAHKALRKQAELPEV